MSTAFDKIMNGIRDAGDYLDGKRDSFAVHEVKVSRPDVVTIRNKTGLSQPAFAKCIDVSLNTLKNWEMGRQHPEGPARILLALIEKQPSIIRKEQGL